MNKNLPDSLAATLKKIRLPELDLSLAEYCSIASASEQSIHIDLHIPLSSGLANIQQQITALLREQGFTPNVIVDINIEKYQFAQAVSQNHPKNNSKITPPKALPSVKNIIAIASGKGGVGKSTTAINMAIALQQGGARVGLLDADIFGPSQSLLSGTPTDTRPETQEDKYFIPIKAHGLQIMSMGFLTTDKTPAVWRGPMASGALQQMLNQTLWDNLDYLIVDMPPGTGDIQLTLSQSCPLTAAIIVTTPQDLALLDAVKGIEMFRKVNVPILGLVENMSVHICSQCGHSEALFGCDGGKQAAQEYNVPLLAQLPLELKIRTQADLGQPIIIAEPSCTAAQTYRNAALRMATELCKLEVERGIPNVVNLR